MGADRKDRYAPRAVDRSAGWLLIFKRKTVLGTSRAHPPAAADTPHRRVHATATWIGSVSVRAACSAPGIASCAQRPNLWIGSKATSALAVCSYLPQARRGGNPGHRSVVDALLSDLSLDANSSSVKFSLCFLAMLATAKLHGSLAVAVRAVVSSSVARASAQDQLQSKVAHGRREVNRQPPAPPQDQASLARQACWPEAPEYCRGRHACQTEGRLVDVYARPCRHTPDRHSSGANAPSRQVGGGW